MIKHLSRHISSKNKKYVLKVFKKKVLILKNDYCTTICGTVTIGNTNKDENTLRFSGLNVKPN